MRPRLTAIVLTYNEVRTIGRCLDSLAFCDERIVIDDYSTDGTFELLASRTDVQVVRNRHTTIADQRALGKRLASGSWLLTMDADEYVTPALADGILAVLAEPKPADGYYLRRRNPYPRGLRGEFWSEHPRLTKTALSRWIQTASPHSPLDKTGMRFRRIARPGAYLDHEPLPSLAAMVRKLLNRSATIAYQEVQQGRRTSSLRLVLSVVSRFLKMYALGGAWRYGLHGLVFAGATAFEAWAKHASLAEGVVPAPMVDGGPGSLATHERATLNG